MERLLIAREDARLAELASFLRARRAAIAPEEIGLAPSRRRRAAGLLREEVAQRAGISATWYTWLEQARPVNPSARVLDGLAEALQLDAAERGHLYALARPDLDPEPPPAATGVSPALASILAGLKPHPAYLINFRFDVIDWNEPADDLLGFSKIDAEHRNIMRLLFEDRAWRELFVEWEEVALSATAQFRASVARRAADPDIKELIAFLDSASSDFARFWRLQNVEAPRIWRKTLVHPERGRHAYNYGSFTAGGSDEGLWLIIYTSAEA